MDPRLREFSREGQAEEVSNSSSKVYQTWGPTLSRLLHSSLPPVVGMISPILNAPTMVYYERHRRHDVVDIRSLQATCGGCMRLVCFRICFPLLDSSSLCTHANDDARP